VENKVIKSFNGELKSQFRRSKLIVESKTSYYVGVNLKAPDWLGDTQLNWLQEIIQTDIEVDSEKKSTSNQQLKLRKESLFNYRFSDIEPFELNKSDSKYSVI